MPSEAESALVKKSGAKGVAEAIEQVAAQWRRQLGLRDAEPLGWSRIVALARLHRIHEIESDEIGSACSIGGLIIRDRGLAVKIKSSMHRFEYGFTLAHEIGHAFLLDLSATPPRRLFLWSLAEERLVDALARALLVPHTVIASIQRPSELDSIARRYEIPLWQLAARCAETGGWQATAALKWQVQPNGTAVVIGYAKGPSSGYLPTRKRSWLAHSDDRNSYIWEFLPQRYWTVTQASPGFGFLRGTWEVAGRGASRRDIVICLYRPLSRRI